MRYQKIIESIGQRVDGICKTLRRNPTETRAVFIYCDGLKTMRPETDIFNAYYERMPNNMVGVYDVTVPAKIINRDIRETINYLLEQ